MASTTPVQSSPLAILAAAIQLDSLCISRDVMPHHYVARAWILDLQPSQIVAAIVAVEAEIKKTYPLMHRSGWRASAEGLYLYFYAWTQTAPPARAGECIACGAPVEAHFNQTNRFVGCAVASRRSA